MASSQEFVDFVIGQIEDAGEIVAKKMFGEYAIYADGKIFGLICENQLFIKPTKSGKKFIGDVTEAPPYKGAKPSFLIQDKIEDKKWLSKLVRISSKELPIPKPKKKKVAQKKKNFMEKYLKIKKLFEQNANKEKATQEARYMRDKFSFYGIHTPLRKSIYKEFLKEEKRNKKIDWDFLDKCYEDEYREFQYLAIDYLIAFQKFLTYDDASKIFRYVKKKQWWDTIDKFDRILGNIGLNDKRIDDLMLKYSTDEDFWVRRIAIDHQLLRKEKTNTQLLEKIIVNNLPSDEFFINKAIGWSLRDYSKTNPNWVRDFIKKYKTKMDKLSIKEASKYV